MLLLYELRTKVKFMDTTLFFIIFILSIALLLLLLFVYQSTRSSFKSKDGLSFSTQAECESYENLIIKIKAFYEIDLNKRGEEKILNISSGFIKKLTTEGFIDPKTLISYKDEFNLLSKILSS